MTSCAAISAIKNPARINMGGSDKSLSKADNDLQVGIRWAQLLREQYGTDYHAFKRISQDFRCDARTAKAWLANQKPDIGQLARAAQLFGALPALGVLHPDDETTKRIQLAEDIHLLKQRLQKMQQLIGEVSLELEETA